MRPGSEIKVSVVVPIYNAERYIWDCLDSLLSQTFKDIEIVCIDIGSTDSTISILERYIKHDKRIKIFKNQNKSLCELLKISLEHTKGKYLYFVKATDFIEEKLIANLYQCGEAADADLVVSSCNLYDTNEHVLLDKQIFVEELDVLHNGVIAFGDLEESTKKPLFSDIFNKFILRDFLEINQIDNIDDDVCYDKLFSNAQRLIALETKRSGYCKRVACEETKAMCFSGGTKAPLVSVIIPVYNSERFLWECLDSLRNQTLREIEIICVDDGSTDNSMCVLQCVF